MKQIQPPPFFANNWERVGTILLGVLILAGMGAFIWRMSRPPQSVVMSGSKPGMINICAYEGDKMYNLSRVSDAIITNLHGVDSITINLDKP